MTPESRVGTTVGAYRLERIVGEGGMGVVYEGRHETLDTQVAVKLLHPHFLRDAEVVRRFVREAKSAAKIRHPNVVRVFDLLATSDGGQAIVMDFLEGEPLSSIIRRGALPPARAAALLVPIMEALEVAHAQGIVHRDLKPDNVFVCSTPSGEVPVLVDFGIAKLTDGGGTHATRTGALIGTPAYMSPEQARGLTEVGPQTDVWAMGAVLYECLSGRTPLLANTAQGMLAAILTEDPPPLASVVRVPVPLATVVDTALMRDVGRRYPDMRTFRHALAGALGIIPAKDTAPPPASPSAPRVDPFAATGISDPHMAPANVAQTTLPRGRSRSPVWFLGLGVLAVLAVGGGLFAALGGRTATRVLDQAPPAAPTATVRAPEVVTEAEPPAEPEPTGEAPPPIEEPAEETRVESMRETRTRSYGGQSDADEVLLARNDPPPPPRDGRRPSRMSRAGSGSDIDELLAGAVGGGMARAESAGGSGPVTPSRSDVIRAMRAVQGAVGACADTPLRANVRIVFGSNGRVRSAAVTSADIPPGVASCVARAVRGARLPPFQQASFSVQFPFRLGE